MAKIRLSVPVEAVKTVSNALAKTPYREGRVLEGVTTSSVRVMKLGENSWYKYQNLLIEMDKPLDGVFMKTGSVYQDLNTGKCVKLDGVKNKFVLKTSDGFKNFDTKTMGDADRLVVGALQSSLDAIIGDHHKELLNPLVDTKSVIIAAHNVLGKFPYHKLADFESIDNTARAAFSIARKVKTYNAGFKTAHWVSIAGDDGKDDNNNNKTYNEALASVDESKSLHSSFKTEFQGYIKKGYVSLLEVDNICQILESAMLNSSLKFNKEYSKQLVGDIGGDLNGVRGECVGYTTERSRNGSAKYVVWLKGDDGSCLKLTSGTPYKKKLLVDSFKNKSELELSGNVSSHVPAVEYGKASSVLSKLNRPAITEINVSPSKLTPSLRTSMEQVEKYSQIRMRM